jgi:hypothetical protein
MSKHEDDTYEVDQMRVRNRLLASRVKKLQKSSDETFTALCEISAAAAALFQIWTAADLDCEPQDYDIIVEYATTAIAAFRESQVSKEPQY